MIATTVLYTIGAIALAAAAVHRIREVRRGR